MADNNSNTFIAKKVTNPLWVGEALTPHIQKFLEQVNIPTIDYQTLYSYLTGVVQYGGDGAELWVVLENKVPVAFANWSVKPLPARGTVGCDYIYSWNRMSEPIMLLLDEFIEFGKRHHSPIYTAVLMSETIWRVFRKAASKKGFNLEKRESIYVIGRKR